MKITDPTQPYQHHPEILALAKNRSAAGLRLDVQTAKTHHAAAVAAQKQLISIIRAELDPDRPTEHPAIMGKYELVCQVIDANERAKHHRLTQLRQAVAAAMENETGKPHWFGWHADSANDDGTTNIALGVRPL